MISAIMGSPSFAERSITTSPRYALCDAAKLIPLAARRRKTRACVQAAPVVVHRPCGHDRACFRSERAYTSAREGCVHHLRLRALIPHYNYTALLCLVACLPMAAFGQAPQDTSDSELNEVIVTGSRIPRSVTEQTGPVIVVTAADIERMGSDAISEVLQALPIQTGMTQNTNDNNGDGSARINLRGLGAERTLVLLNGRRFIFGGLGADSSVDLNTIPISLIDHVEIFGSGASAIYGSDAVAGVVNVITRKKFSGVEAGA